MKQNTHKTVKETNATKNQTEHILNNALRLRQQNKTEHIRNSTRDSNVKNSQTEHREKEQKSLT